MTSERTFLVATDLSERSDRALQRAFQLAAQSGARLKIVSFVDDALPADMAQEMKAKAEKHLTAQAAKLAGDVGYDIAVEAGEPVTQLVAAANSEGIDLLIVGTHRRRGIMDGFRQTTVETVIAQSRKPVLLVTSPVDTAYQKVLAPVSFSPACQQALRSAKTLAPDAGFRLYHAWVVPFEGLTGGADSAFGQSVERELRDQALLWAKTLPEGLPAVELIASGVNAGLDSELGRYKPDLLAVGAHTRSLSFSGLGSFTASLVRHAPVDLLVVRGAAA